jgi:hypothetical protein
MTRPFLAAAGLALALLTACAAPSTAVPIPTPTPTSTAPATSAPAVTGTAVADAPVLVTEATGPGDGFGLLTAARTGAQPGADRIVFEFEAAVPEYRIAYQDLPVYSDPVGEVVPLDGTAALAVSLIGSSRYRSIEDQQPVTDVPQRITAGLEQVTELVNLGDWEGVLVWAAGVRDRTGFSVSVLDGPPRLVIDVAR